MHLRHVYLKAKQGARRVAAAGLVGLRDRIDRILQTRSSNSVSDTLPDINHTLHDSRSARLRKLPPIGGTLLSAGCAGTWYFHWIAERTGHSGRHIGIEFYSPKPADLPANVEWIANTAANMHSVEDESCELVFSGQNLEHLWPEEVVGFLLESHRVLEPGGLLVVDSPNRLMTAPLVWSHPEHTVEISPAEARQLAELAGFQVTAVKGIWLCRDARGNRMLPLDPRQTDPRYTYVERLLAAEDDPDNSFLWWLEARKQADPQPERLRAEMNRIFAEAWPERTQRFLSLVGARVRTAQGEEIRCPQGTAGVLVYGPYMPLQAGSYGVTFNVQAQFTSGGAVREPVVTCDVLGDQGRQIVSRSLTVEEVVRSNGAISLSFALPKLEFGMQARCISHGLAAVNCSLPIRFERSAVAD